MAVKRLSDYIDQVHAKFDKLSKDEISKILNYGFRKYHYINYSGGDVMIRETNKLKILVYTGVLFLDFKKYYKYYIKKYSIKFRLLNNRRKIKWDGYYYFGLSDRLLSEYTDQIEDSLLIFEDIVLFRLLDELKTHLGHTHYFKVKSDEYRGYSFYARLFEIENDKITKIT